MRTLTGARLVSLVIAVFATAQGSSADADAEPLPTTGKLVPALAPFDELMEEFVVKHKIPGAVLAVAKDNRLLYSRAFGYSDTENDMPVQPESMFRIASISKPITAVAVLQLVEQGRLRLNDPMMKHLGPELLEDPPLDDRWNAITIRHLLQHRGGWDRNASFDPMFRSHKIVDELDVSAPADPVATIRYMARRELDFSPGERYAYSNFGYCLLGRVIEKVTHQDYGIAVYDLVLNRVDPSAFLLGRTEWANRNENEVVYYANSLINPRSVFREERVKPPYGAWCLETMDAHGGWVASAPALVRFASMSLSSRRSLLTDETMALTTERPEGWAGWNADGQPKAVFYGLGWLVRPINDNRPNLWHGGSLPGTNTLLVHRHDGLIWAVLFNTRDIPGSRDPVSRIDPLLHRAAEKVERWPDHNLWESTR